MPLLFTGDWFSGNIPVWEKTLAHFKGKPDLHFLEIGSYEGRSACWLLTSVLTHETCRLTCIDIFHLCDESVEISTRLKLPMSKGEDCEKRFDHNIRALRAEHKVTKLKGRSDELLYTLPLSSFDCIYIDGSHTSKAVLTDAVLSWGLLKKNGILIFDDYGWDCFPEAPLKNPRIALDAFLEIFAGNYELIERGWQVIVRKVS